MCTGHGKLIEFDLGLEKLRTIRYSHRRSQNLEASSRIPWFPTYLFSTLRGLSQKIVYIVNILNRVPYHVWNLVGTDRNIIFLLHIVKNWSIYRNMNYLGRNIQGQMWVHGATHDCMLNWNTVFIFFCYMSIKINNYQFVLFINRKRDINILIRSKILNL